LLGALIAFVFGFFLKGIGVDRRSAGRIAGIVFIITVAVCLMK